MDIIAYLNKNNIIIDGRFVRGEFDIRSQIELIIMVHNKLMSNNITIIPRINSTIGKDIETFRVQVKKVDKKIRLLRMNDMKTDLDIYMLEKGGEILERAQRSLDFIDNEAYFELIKRSMKKYEMCLGRVDEGNLKINKDGVTVIRTEKYISYNLIEHDLFNYIKRLKRKNRNIQVDEIIREFILKSSLSSSSENYLRAICNYPVEAMKVMNKYKANDIDESNEWINMVDSAMDIDGDEII